MLYKRPSTILSKIVDSTIVDKYINHNPRPRQPKIWWDDLIFNEFRNEFSPNDTYANILEGEDYKHIKYSTREEAQKNLEKDKKEFYDKVYEIYKQRAGYK